MFDISVKFAILSALDASMLDISNFLPDNNSCLNKNMEFFIASSTGLGN